MAFHKRIPSILLYHLNPKVHFNYLHMIKKLYDLLNLIEIVDVLDNVGMGMGIRF